MGVVLADRWDQRVTRVQGLGLPEANWACLLSKPWFPHEHARTGCTAAVGAIEAEVTVVRSERRTTQPVGASVVGQHGTPGADQMEMDDFVLTKRARAHRSFG